MKFSGCGKKYGEQWKKEQESKGLKVYQYRTSDNLWGYRKPRQKNGIKEVLRVWAAGKGFQGLWYYAK